MKLHAFGCLVFATLAGCATSRNTHELLNGVVWMQTSAEYAMATTQTYQAATAQLEQALSDRGWTAATEQTGEFGKLPPAVILDVDETVLDNSPFEARMIQNGATFDPKLWGAWVREERATPIPGVREFIARAKTLGVQVFYVTNRAHGNEAATVRNLQQVDADVTAERVLCKKENGWTSDKTSRRRHLAANHRILMLFGDDYNDFVFLSKVSPEQRVQRATQHKNRWGRQWFLMPNPLYGNWERALYNYNSSLPDAEKLRRKHAALRDR